MALSRRERQRMREIEQRLDEEDPELSRSLTHFDVADPEPREPLPWRVFAAVAAVVFGVVLIITALLALGTGAEPLGPLLSTSHAAAPGG